MNYKQTGPNEFAPTNCDCGEFHTGYPEHVASHIVFAREHHEEFMAEQLRLRDRVAPELHPRLPHRDCQFDHCPADGTLRRVVAALGNDGVTNVRLLHNAVDLAIAHLDGKA